jgi:hypothetical protein
VAGEAFFNCDAALGNIQNIAEKINQFFIGFSFRRRRRYLQVPDTFLNSHYFVAFRAGMHLYRNSYRFLFHSGILPILIISISYLFSV